MKRLRKIRRGDSYTLLESSAMTWLGNYLTGKYYTYWGSLTTPPCNEVVTWIVLENAVEIGYRQVQYFLIRNYFVHLSITETTAISYYYKPTQKGLVVVMIYCCVI